MSLASPICNRACAIALPIVISVVGTSLVFVTVFAIYLQRKLSKSQRQTRQPAQDSEKAPTVRMSASAMSHPPMISVPMPIPGSGPDVRGLVPISPSARTRQQSVAGMPMPGTMKTSQSEMPLPPISSGCKAMSMKDRIRVMFGLKPRCLCPNCKDNPRFRPGRPAHQNITYNTSRGIDWVVPPPQQRPAVSDNGNGTRRVEEEILPIYIQNAKENLPGHPNYSSSRSATSGSEYSVSQNPSRGHTPPPTHDIPLDPRSRSTSPMNTGGPASPFQTPASPPPLAPQQRSPHSHTLSNRSARSQSSLRNGTRRERSVPPSPGLPQSPRPRHQPSKDLKPRMQRDLVSVGLAIEDGGLGGEHDGGMMHHEDGERMEMGMPVGMAMDMPPISIDMPMPMERAERMNLTTGTVA